VVTARAQLAVVLVAELEAEPLRRGRRRPVLRELRVRLRRVAVR
jgi:hypothetical protein